MRLLMISAIVASITMFSSNRTIRALQWQPSASMFLSASAAGALTFAKVAVSNRIPTGIVASATAMHGARRAAAVGTDPRDHDLPSVISAFNAAHSGYQATLITGNVLMIDDVHEPELIKGLLSGTYKAFQVDRTQAFAAILRVGDLLARTPDVGGGIAGDASPACPVDTSVTIRLDHPTALDVLNEIARQTLTGWILMYDLDARSDTLQLGMLCPNGGSEYFTVRGW